MSFMEIVEMYIAWAYGYDDEIRQSDVICECLDAGFEYNDVAEAGDEKMWKFNLC